MSTQTTGAGLEPYRELARSLAAAKQSVEGIQQDIVSTTLARDTALSQRQALLSNWTETEQEESVTELSKLGARAEVFEAKLKAQADKLASVTTELKTTLDHFGLAFRTLHSQLSTFLFNAELDRLTSFVHSDLRIRSRATCSELAAITTSVIDAGPLRIPTLGDFYQADPPPAEVMRLAGLSLEKSEPLLVEAAKHADFAPPAVAQPRASLAAAA